MVRRDPDRGYHSGLSSPEPLSPRPRGIHSEQLRERSRPAAPQDQPQPPKLPAQAVCVVKRFRLRSRSRGPALPVAPASDSTQLEHAPSMSDKPRLLPLSVVPRPSTGLPVPEPPAARRPTPPWSVNSTKRPRMPWHLQPSSQQVHHVSFRPRMPQPPSKGGLQLLRPSSEMVSAYAGGRSPQT